MRSARRWMRGLGAAIAFALVAFAVVEKLHTHEPWSARAESPTLSRTGAVQAGPGDCPACRAAGERATVVPPGIASAPTLGFDDAVATTAHAVPARPLDRSAAPRGPPLPPPPFS